MNPQDSIKRSSLRSNSIQNREQRRFYRYKIKRRVLIKNPDGKILTGHAFDISRQGLQLRCHPKTAYQLETANPLLPKNKQKHYEIKISLPYMSRLSECGIHCSIQDIEKADDENMRISITFLSFDKNSQSCLDHFIKNLTHE